MRVRAFTRYARDAASTRYRLLQFLPDLRAAGIEVEWHPLLAEGHLQQLVAGRSASALRSVSAYRERLAQLRAAPKPDLLWVYVELFPFVPAFIEAGLLPRGVPLVIDWDDAFHVRYRKHGRAAVRRLLGGKLEAMFRRAALVTCGNAYLASEAAPHCPHTAVIPTVVDTDLYRPIAKATAAPVVCGWIGSPSTWPNVRPLLPTFARLHCETGLRFRAIGAGDAAEADRFDGLELVEWKEATEVGEVQRFDIGVMPLLDRPFERGKSGFKLIQYMACGLPTVASPVGVNSSIIRHGEDGFLATTAGEWEGGLRQLLGDAALRQRMGAAGRARAVSDYSLAVTAPRLVELLREAAKAR